MPNPPPQLDNIVQVFSLSAHPASSIQHPASSIQRVGGSTMINLKEAKGARDGNTRQGLFLLSFD